MSDLLYLENIKMVSLFIIFCKKGGAQLKPPNPHACSDDKLLVN